MPIDPCPAGSDDSEDPGLQSPESSDLSLFGGDGITADGTGTFLVSDFNGSLLRMTPTGDREVIIDSRDAGINLTDFAFASDRSLVVVRGGTEQSRGREGWARLLTRNVMRYIMPL